MAWTRTLSPPVGRWTSPLLPPSLRPASLLPPATVQRSPWLGVWAARRDKVWGHSSSLLFLTNVIGSWGDGRARSVPSGRCVRDAQEGWCRPRGWAEGRWNDASRGRAGRRPACGRQSGLSAWWLKTERRVSECVMEASFASVRSRIFYYCVLLALYAGESGVSPTGDKGQRYSWIWSMLIAQFRIASLWWWIVEGLQRQHFWDVKNVCWYNSCQFWGEPYKGSAVQHVTGVVLLWMQKQC